MCAKQAFKICTRATAERLANEFHYKIGLNFLNKTSARKFKALQLDNSFINLVFTPNKVHLYKAYPLVGIEIPMNKTRLNQFT